MRLVSFISANRVAKFFVLEKEKQSVVDAFNKTLAGRAPGFQRISSNSPARLKIIAVSRTEELFTSGCPFPSHFGYV